MHQQSAHDVLSSIMGVGGARSGSINNNNNHHVMNNDPISSILFLLASDVLAGVGLKSALRSFLRSHVPLIEFSTGVQVNVHQLDQPEEGRGQLMPNALLSTMPQDSYDGVEGPFVVQVKGLKNRGQTCYANSVMQAMASLPPLYTYLETMQKKKCQDGDKNNNAVSLALYQTLQHINGHKVTPAISSNKRNTKSSFLPIPTTAAIASLFSSVVSSTRTTPGDPQRVMDIVAKHHSQFRCRNSIGMAGMTEQQDSHEFFSALMDVLSTEEEDEEQEDDKEDGGDEGSSSIDAQSSTRSIASYGLSFLRSDNHHGEGGDDDASNDEDIDHDFADEYRVKGGEGFKDNEGGILSGGFTDEEIDEEEKKHDEHHHADRSSADEVGYQRSGARKGSPPNFKEHKPAAALPHHKTHTSESATQNPFDGWSGSTIKCATCRHIRPIRSTPFLGLSLPIANIRSEFLEDFLAAEYGGFATAERVSDVQCFSCAIQQKIAELEDEEMLLDGAISSIQRRNKGKKLVTTPRSYGNGAKEGTNDQEDIAGLVEESQQMKRKIAILKALDPDADEDKLECRDKQDTQQEIELGIGNSLPPIVPQRGDAFKASLVMRPPEVLCIHIQRRHYDMACQRMVKVSRHVHFDEILDLGAYCAYGENSFENQQSLTNIGPNSARIPYKLMSVVEHLGNAFGGHYQTYRRVDPEQNDWVLVSDECISSRSWDDVRSCQAYMLFYVAVST